MRDRLKGSNHTRPGADAYDRRYGIPYVLFPAPPMSDSGAWVYPLPALDVIVSLVLPHDSVVVK